MMKMAVTYPLASLLAIRARYRVLTGGEINPGAIKNAERDNSERRGRPAFRSGNIGTRAQGRLQGPFRESRRVETRLDGSERRAKIDLLNCSLPFGVCPLTQSWWVLGRACIDQRAPFATLTGLLTIWRQTRRGQPMMTTDPLGYCYDAYGK